MKTEDVGNKIKQLRNKNRLTQAELGKKLGVTYQAISNWENGRNTPDLQILIKIAEVFNISVDELLLLVDPHEEEYQTIHSIGSLKLLDLNLNLSKISVIITGMMF